MKIMPLRFTGKIRKYKSLAKKSTFFIYYYPFFFLSCAIENSYMDNCAIETKKFIIIIIINIIIINIYDNNIYQNL